MPRCMRSPSSLRREPSWKKELDAPGGVTFFKTIPVLPVMKRYVLPSVLSAALLAACGWGAFAAAHRGEPGVFHGNVDIREVSLGLRVPGRVTAVLKDQGDSVKAGETLVLLDDEPYRHALDRAEAEVAAASARADELRHGSRPEDISRAESELAARRVERDNAASLLDRMKGLLESRAVSPRDLDDARSALDGAQARHDAAAAQLALLKAGTRAEQVAQAEAALLAAKAAAATARMQLADTRLIAPESGVVLTRAVEAGSIVQPGATALSLSLRSPVWVRAYVTGPELGAVVPGRAVFVYTDSRKEPYHGQVGDVSPRAEFTPKSVESRELRPSLVYRFRVVVRDADDGLRQGMPVSVKLASE